MFGKESSSSQYTQHIPIQMNKKTSTTNTYHHHTHKNQKHNHHTKRHPREPIPYIRTMRANQPYDHPHIRSQHRTEPQQPPLHGENRHTVCHKPHQHTQQHRPSPRKLHLIHDKQPKYHVAQDVQIILMHEHSRKSLIHIHRVILHFLHIQQQVISLRGHLQEKLIRRWRKHQMDDNERDHINPQQQRINRLCSILKQPSSLEGTRGVSMNGNLNGSAIIIQNVYKFYPYNIMISSIQLKRAKLAAELRQQHRRRIFQSKRQSNSQSTEQLFEYREQLQQRTESKKVLTTLPPYVNQLSEEEICAALELCGKVLEENIIMEQATACLVELTTLKLPTPTLNLLQTQILPRIMQLLQSTNNLQILINCVYICGNCLTTSLYQNKSVIKQVLLKVEVLCSQYPHYGNCLQLMVWYLRGVSLLYPSEDLCMYTFSMSKRIIITGLTHLQEKPSEAPSYFQLLRQCFNLLELTVTQQCINDQESMGPDSWLSDVDECVRAVLAHTSARADDIVMGSVSELLTVLVGCGRFVGSVVEFCMLATFRQVKCDSCFAVCSRMLRSELVPKQVKENLGKNMLTNLHQVLHSPEIVMKRSYRIDVMNCISTIVDELNVALSLFSAELLEGIVNVMELVWIDKDQENIANSLKLLLTLGQSLEIKGCHFRAQFFTSDRECTLIELQNHTNEQVYNMATEMIDYLGIEY